MDKPQNRPRAGWDPNIGKATQFKPGNRANPGGRPKTDLAAEVARLAFEGMNAQEAARALRAMCKRNPKMFQVLADRAYGKLKIPIENRSPLDDLTDDQLRERLKILRAKEID